MTIVYKIILKTKFKKNLVLIIFKTIRVVFFFIFLKHKYNDKNKDNNLEQFEWQITLKNFISCKRL